MVMSNKNGKYTIMFFIISIGTGVGLSLLLSSLTWWFVFEWWHYFLMSMTIAFFSFLIAYKIVKKLKPEMRAW